MNKIVRHIGHWCLLCMFTPLTRHNMTNGKWVLYYNCIGKGTNCYDSLCQWLVRDYHRFNLFCYIHIPTLKNICLTQTFFFRIKYLQRLSSTVYVHTIIFFTAIEKSGVKFNERWHRHCTCAIHPDQCTMLVLIFNRHVVIPIV